MLGTGLCLYRLSVNTGREVAIRISSYQSIKKRIVLLVSVSIVKWIVGC